MSEMIERVAQALVDEFGYVGLEGHYPQDVARAAIEAIREPIELQLQVAARIGFDASSEGFNGEWRDRETTSERVDAMLVDELRARGLIPPARP
jgi:hypothetical protein